MYSTPLPTCPPFPTQEQSFIDECSPITLFPMGVECSIINPTTFGYSDGSIELLVTGGTSPYTATWNNGLNGLSITNLSAGTYTATVSDYYGDFTFVKTCTLTATTILNCLNDNLVTNGDFTTSLSGWTNEFESWIWSGGSALYYGSDQGADMYQTILTPLSYYEISFVVVLPDSFQQFYVYAGTNIYTPTLSTGVNNITITLQCTDNGNFGFYGYDDTNMELYIDNVCVLPVNL